MKNYYDLEINILSCLLQESKLMEHIIVEDKHFIKHKKLWVFMKAFYEKFHCFDLNLMYSVANNKFEMISYIEWLVNVEPAPSRFMKYQKQLIELYEQSKKEKWIKEQIFELANKLYVGTIDLSTFIDRLNGIYDKSDELYSEEQNGQN